MAKSKWFEQYQLVPLSEVPKKAGKFTVENYDPFEKAGKFTVENYDTASKLRRSILGSMRDKRYDKELLGFDVRTKVVFNDGKYDVYFWKETKGE